MNGLSCNGIKLSNLLVRNLRYKYNTFPPDANIHIQFSKNHCSVIATPCLIYNLSSCDISERLFTLTISSIDSIDKLHASASGTPSEQDLIIQKASLEGRMRQVNPARPENNSFPAKVKSTDLRVHPNQKILHRLPQRVRCPTRRREQTSRQTDQRLPTVLTKSRWLDGRDSGKSCRHD